MTGIRRISSLICAVVGAFTIAALAGCSETEFDGGILGAWPSAEIAAIPDTLVLAEYELVINGSANRDFMPISPPGGRPMYSRVVVRETSEVEISQVFHDPTLFVINGERMWVVELQYQASGGVGTYRQFFYADSGPLWQPGDYVDIVFGFTDDVGVYHRVIDRNVKITESS